MTEVKADDTAPRSAFVPPCQVDKTPNTRETYDSSHRVCVLRSEHYLVLGSIGMDRRAVKLFTVVLDTGSAMNVIRSDSLPRSWERARVSPSDGQKLTDANAKPSSIPFAVRLTVQLGANSSLETFYVALTR